MMHVFVTGGACGEAAPNTSHNDNATSHWLSRFPTFARWHTQPLCKLRSAISQGPHLPLNAFE